METTTDDRLQKNGTILNVIHERKFKCYRNALGTYSLVPSCTRNPTVVEHTSADSPIINANELHQWGFFWIVKSLQPFNQGKRARPSSSYHLEGYFAVVWRGSTRIFAACAIRSSVMVNIEHPLILDCRRLHSKFSWPELSSCLAIASNSDRIFEEKFCTKNFFLKFQRANAENRAHAKLPKLSSFGQNTRILHLIGLPLASNKTYKPYFSRSQKSAVFTRFTMMIAKWGFDLVYHWNTTFTALLYPFWGNESSLLFAVQWPLQRTNAFSSECNANHSPRNRLMLIKNTKTKFIFNLQSPVHGLTPDSALVRYRFCTSPSKD